VSTLGLHRDGAGGGQLEQEAHHRLVHRPDLLHVERPVGDALAIEHEQPVEHAVDRSVRHEGRLDPLAMLPRRHFGAALEERETVGVEQNPVALRHPDLRRLGPVVHHPEEREQLCPSAVALVHRVRVVGGVVAQALVEPDERVVAQERLVARQHLALLGIKQEHEPENHREQRAVHLVRVLCKRPLQECASRPVVGGLEAAQQLVERVQYLPGQLLAHLVLEPAAGLQEGGEPLRARQRQEPGLAQQQAHRGADRPTGRLRHLRDAEVEPAGALAPRR
jgi:hypothetical protein